MADLVQLLVAGLATGAIYALAAIGFTLLWQTSQTINFAQGEFVMVPAFLALIAMQLFGLPFAAALVFSILCSMLLLGIVFRFVVVGPLIFRGVLPLVISTIALGILLKESVKDFYSAEAHTFPTLLPDTIVTVAGVSVSLAQLGMLAAALLTIGLLQWFLIGTFTGRQMQATAQNPVVARILGVPVERMILYTFLINAGLAAVASILISPIYLAKFSNGETLGLIAFVAAIVGGFNQVRGAIVGGLLIGVLDNLVAAYVSTAYRQAIPLILLVLIILFRPQGLLGRREERAV
jgi:branched-chain amino acid transport system permease protein